MSHALESIQRQLLNFDAIKRCSITLVNLNVYCCLICGKYFHGKTRNTPLFDHALQTGHNLCINLHDGNIFCTTKNLPIFDPVLDDIKYNLSPVFGNEIFYGVCHDLKKRPYYPGFIGINSSHTNITVLFYLLAHIKPLRNILLKNNFESEFCAKMGHLTKKLWSSRAFKCHTNPSELLELFSDKEKEPFHYLPWILHSLCKEIKQFSQLHKGKLEIKTFPVDNFTIQSGIETTQTSFLYLSFDLPSNPLFVQEELTPTSILELLEKYNGKIIRNKSWRFLELPRFLILHFKRFVTNRFDQEKNRTLITFPLTDLQIDDSRFNLVCNICLAENGFKIQIYSQYLNKWMEIEKCNVKEIQAEEIFLSQTYIQLWEESNQ